MKVKVERLYKIFGNSPHDALAMLEKGRSKEDVLKKTRNVVALNDVSFSVEEGETFVVMGLSGSGKSTLVRCLNRLIEPTSGSVEIDGEEVIGASTEKLREIRRTKMSMVFQHFGLFPHKSVMDNVEYGLKVRGIGKEERKDKAVKALELVGLEGWADRKPGALSGGMQQRVGLARALATDPEILLMDEAFSALDPLIRREMQDELIQLQRNVQKTIVFITHDLNEALKLGDRIAVMKDGAIVQIGTPEEIVSEPANDYVAAFIRDVDRGRVLAVSSIMQGEEALVQGHANIRTAMLRMKDTGRDALYVTDRKGKPVGLVTDKDVAQAFRENKKEIDHLIKTDFPKVLGSAPIMDTYALCVSGLPIAVVDENDILQGVVNQIDVLTNIALDSEPDAQQTSSDEQDKSVDIDKELSAI